VGHAFTSEYTHRFKRDFESLEVIYECGDEERTLAHIIFDCLLLLRARNEARGVHTHPSSASLAPWTERSNSTLSLNEPPPPISQHATLGSLVFPGLIPPEGLVLGR
jgi:hypothetical protein